MPVTVALAIGDVDNPTLFYSPMSPGAADPHLPAICVNHAIACHRSEMIVDLLDGGLLFRVVHESILPLSSSPWNPSEVLILRRKSLRGD